MERICTLSPISPQGIFPSLHTHRSPWAKRPFQPTPPCSASGAPGGSHRPRVPHGSHPSAPRAARARRSPSRCPSPVRPAGSPSNPERGSPGEGLHPLREGRPNPFLRRRNPVWGRGMSCPHTAG